VAGVFLVQRTVATQVGEGIVGQAQGALDLVGEEKVLSSMLRRAVKMMQN